MPSHDISYYNSLNYRFECRFDERDQVYVVRFPELPGCVAHGETITTAIRRAQEFKKEWLTSALEGGNHIAEPEPEPEHSGKLVLRLSRTAHRRVAELATEENISINAYISQAVTEKLERAGMKKLAEQIYSYLESTRGIIIGPESSRRRRRGNSSSRRTASS